MNATLLWAVLLCGAEPSWEIQARVVRVADEREVLSDMVEPWIAQAVVRAGVAKVAPAGRWIALNPDDVRIFTSERGGRLIDARANLENDQFVVEICGCQGTPIEGNAKLTARADSRQVIRLVDGKLPLEFFVALRVVPRAAPAHGTRTPAAQSSASPAAKAFVAIQAAPPGTGVTFQLERDATIVDVASEVGIGRTVLTRTADAWPPALRIRLRFKGLELFRVTAEETTVQWSVASTRPHEVRTSRVRGSDETPLAKGDPLFAELHIVAKELAIPLTSGYFEVAVPTKLLASNPRELRLQWIDFYRN